VNYNKELQKQYTGIDIDIQISLHEYNLIWKIKDKDYFFIYKIGKKYDLSYLPIDTDIYEYNWVNWNQFLNFVGMNKKDFDKLELPIKIFDLIAYYGFENIFGTCYNKYSYKEILRIAIKE
jgi:hypothetical protein